MPLGKQTARPGFVKAANEAAAPPPPKSQSPGSAMVKQDKPYPAPRPSPEMAASTDRAVFNANWDREVKQAEARNCAARRAAFKAARTKQPTLKRAFHRTVAG